MKKKFIELWKKHKEAIIVGLATTLFWEIGRTIFVAIPQAGGRLFDYFGNLPYVNASFQIEKMLIVILVVSILVSLIAMAVSLLIKSVRLSIKTKRLVQYIDSENISPEHSTSNSKVIDSLSDTYKESKDKLVAQSKHLVLSTVLHMLTILFLTFYLFWSIAVPLVLRISFSQSLDLITPYTDTATIQTLKSEWLRMESKEDYRVIDEKITEIKEKNSLK